jgi:hypothetical protein
MEWLGHFHPRFPDSRPSGTWGAEGLGFAVIEPLCASASLGYKLAERMLGYRESKQAPTGQ